MKDKKVGLAGFKKKNWMTNFTFGKKDRSIVEYNQFKYEPKKFNSDTK